ncbi:hypothetical protein AGDE_13086 [Angomonas deanei]|nr:hypothetical protein AGDE_13086 [Angomonas deanei]|eukprot:EPY22755.1 hypothetical protein AGDE_13086 [Angomonas deanei]
MLLAPTGEQREAAPAESAAPSTTQSPPAAAAAPASSYMTVFSSSRFRIPSIPAAGVSSRVYAARGRHGGAGAAAVREQGGARHT